MSLLAWEAALPAARPCQPHRPGSPVQRSANAAADAACSSPSSGMPSLWLRADPPLATCCWWLYRRPPRPASASRR